jgi:hypothetical protein
MDRPTAGLAVLAILLALVAMAVGLMHPPLWGLAIVLGVVAVLGSPSPP